MINSIYIVHSRTNDDLVCQDFNILEDAINYAKENAEYDTYVEQAELDINDFGEVITVRDSAIVWDTRPTVDEAPLPTEPATDISAEDELELEADYEQLIKDYEAEEHTPADAWEDEEMLLKTAPGPLDEQCLQEDLNSDAVSTVAALLQDEWEAIKGYEEAATKLQQSNITNKNNILAVLEHISSEEAMHVGQLEQVLKEINPNYDAKQAEGAIEGSEDLGVTKPVEISEIPTITAEDSTVVVAMDTDGVPAPVQEAFGLTPKLTFKNCSKLSKNDFKKLISKKKYVRVSDTNDAPDTAELIYMDINPDYASSYYYDKATDTIYEDKTVNIHTERITVDTSKLHESVADQVESDEILTRDKCFNLSRDAFRKLIADKEIKVTDYLHQIPKTAEYIYFDFEPYHDVNYYYDKETDTIYEDRMYIGESLKKSTKTGEIDYDQLREATEENENEVECQNCFNLVEKQNCTKTEHGYICNNCLNKESQLAEDLDYNPDAPFRVCADCLAEIESHEGAVASVELSVDSEDEEESTCDWCEESGFDTLYEIIPEDDVKDSESDTDVLRVCSRCLAAIESREGTQPKMICHPDEYDDEDSKCDWCGETGFDTLYRLV